MCTHSAVGPGCEYLAGVGLVEDSHLTPGSAARARVNCGLTGSCGRPDCVHSCDRRISPAHAQSWRPTARVGQGSCGCMGEQAAGAEPRDAGAQ